MDLSGLNIAGSEISHLIVYLSNPYATHFHLWIICLFQFEILHFGFNNGSSRI